MIHQPLRKNGHFFGSKRPGKKAKMGIENEVFKGIVKGK
jgi:hypothetical protein